MFENSIDNNNNNNNNDIVIYEKAIPIKWSNLNDRIQPGHSNTTYVSEMYVLNIKNEHKHLRGTK